MNTRQLLLYIAALFFAVCSGTGFGQDANRLCYLDEFCDPYYPSTRFPALTTRQWVGDKNVDAVVTLGIDDMRDPASYEAYLRPILDRLKKIDGRAPVSILTCSVDPKSEQIQKWLKEGLSIECHTIDHPCPCLNGGDFQAAKSTYDRCVDLMASIENNHPVAFRFPCMDSLNTPSPRAFVEIVNRKTANGNFLQASSSVTCLFDKTDPKLASLFKSDPDRFKKYVPFPSFVNQVQNYPYPFIIGSACWEFPCTIPDDWQGQNLQRPNNPDTVKDLIAAIDATVIKNGMANIVFHPHNWIRAQQINEVISHVDTRYGRRVKFLTFREAVDKINKHLLLAQPLRHPKTGEGNGVRILDLNNDGFMDVLIGNDQLKVTRIWDQKTQAFRDTQHQLQVENLRMGVIKSDVVGLYKSKSNVWTMVRFQEETGQWISIGSAQLPATWETSQVRLRDLDGDGSCEIIGPQKAYTVSLQSTEEENRLRIKLSPRSFPVAVTDEKGQDNGVRFVDLNNDQHVDIVISNDSKSNVYLFRPDRSSFEKTTPKTEIPRIVSGGTNQGVWFANNHLWVQNEHTHRLPDGVDRRQFQQLIGNQDPPPRSAEDSLSALSVHPDFEVELMVSEPLVMDPIAIEWGIDGRLWVVEMADYPLGLDDRGKPGGRVRYLEDTNQDGKYDRSVVFVDEIPFPTGVLPINTDPDQPACLITAAPLLVKATRAGKWSELIEADSKSGQILLQGFTEGNQQHRFNGFSLGLDNWIYLANGDSGGTVSVPGSDSSLSINGRDLRFKLSPQGIEKLETQTGQTQFGRHQDDWGNWFGCANPLPIRHYVLNESYLNRNPHFRYSAARNDLARSDNTQLFPRSQILSHWSGYRPPGIGQAHRFTSACGTNFYRDNLFGDVSSNQVFTCEPVHNLVHRRQLQIDGVTFTSQRPADETDREFLASSDSWFRPTYLTTGPDGALWVVDMYRLVIEHPEWIDDQREKELFLRAGHDKGRIYRIFPKSKKGELRPLPHRDDILGDGMLEKFAMKVNSPNRWQREFSQWHAVQNPDLEIDESLRKFLRNSDEHLTQLTAAATLAGREKLSPADLVPLLNSSHPGLRREAVRLSEPFLAKSTQLSEQVCKIADDPSLAVQLQVAFSLGFAPSESAARTLYKLGSTSTNAAIQSAVASSMHPQNIVTVLNQCKPHGLLSFDTTLMIQAIEMGKADPAMRLLDSKLKSLNVKGVGSQDLQDLSSTFRALAKAFSQDGKLAKSKSARALQKTAVQFSQQVLDADHSPELLSGKLQMMSASPFSSAEEVRDTLLQRLSPRLDPAVQQLIVRELSRNGSLKTVRHFVDNWKFMTPATRNEMIGSIAQRKEWAKYFLQAVGESELSIGQFSSAQRRLFTMHADAEIRNLAEKNLSSKNASHGKRSLLVADYIKKIAALRSEANLTNVSQGKNLFEKHCASCHRLGSIGTSIGPDLATLKKRGDADFARAILDPNLAMESKFQNYAVSLDDGRQVQGVIMEESTTELKLGTPDGKKMSLLRSEIEAIKNTGRSLMPEGLEEELSPVQLLDLIDYLNASRVVPVRGERKSFTGNQPVVLEISAVQKTRIAAASAEIYGPSLVFESKYKNLGFWGSAQDSAVWRIQVKQPMKVEIWMEYACPEQASGNLGQVLSNADAAEFQVATTGSWDQYKTVKIATLKLESSPAIQELEIKPTESLKGFLMDLKALEIRPIQ